MLLQSLLASALAFATLATADSNALRFKRGLPPLPQRHVGMRMRRQAAPSTLPSRNIRVSALRFEMYEGAPVAEMQFRSTVNSDFNIFDLVSTSAPGLKGSFVYTGYVSSTNGEPLYAFQLDNPPLDAAGQPFTYLQAQFQLPGDTVDGQMGAYFGAGKGALRPYPSTSSYEMLDSFAVESQSTIFQLDRSVPGKAKVTVMTLDINSDEHQSIDMCIDGDDTVQLPALFNECWGSAENDQIKNSGTIVAILA